MGENERVTSLRALQPPCCVFEELPGDVGVYSQVIDARLAIENILAGADDRLLVVIGLPQQAIDDQAIEQLANELSVLLPQHTNDLVIMILVDFAMSQFPMTSGSLHINQGIRKARERMLQFNRLGVPTALEFRDTITPQFFADLLAWACVSSDSEVLKQLVSGLSMPVGLRAPAGHAASAVAAMDMTAGKHHFLGVSAEGVCGVVQSTGNPDVIAVLGADAAPEGGVANGAGGAPPSLSSVLATMHKQKPTAAIMAEITADNATAAAVARVAAHVQSPGSL